MPWRRFRRFRHRHMEYSFISVKEGRKEGGKEERIVAGRAKNSGASADNGIFITLAGNTAWDI